MADFDSSLPIRTESDGDVVIFVSDATTPSQKLKVEADGSINVNDNGGSITVDSVDLDIRDLVFATDSVDVSGSEVSLDATTLAALESITVQNAAGASAVNIQDGGNSITVDAVQLDIDDLNATDDIVSAYISDEAGVAFSAANPLYVTSVDGGGTEVNGFNTVAAVAAGATSNHDYTIPVGNDFLFKRVLASASSKMKIEIQVDTTGSYVTKAVGFNSTATPNIIGMDFAPIQLVAGDLIRIIRTNRDNQAQDVYSTIVGVILD